jgi:hypothetical protein
LEVIDFDDVEDCESCKLWAKHNTTYQQKQTI